MPKFSARSKARKTSKVPRGRRAAGGRIKGLFSRFRKSVSGGGWGKKVLVGVGVAGILYAATKARGKPSPNISLKPAPVGANEEVSADRYRLIAARRTGMTYVQATGSLGGTIRFSSPRAGVFTRNVVKEGEALWAEVKA